jgi:phosphatidylglycerophosphate synthase
MMAEQSYTPTDRRPIASRQRPIWRRAAGTLARAGLSPNTISIVGMVAGVLAGIALALTARYPRFSIVLFVAGAVLIQARLLCNMLDGMVAIETATASPVGELYNEVPDRVSDAATLVGLGYAIGGAPALGFLAAICALFVAYVRAAAKVAGAPQDYSGPMAKQHRMFAATLAAIFCAFAPDGWHPRWNDGARGVPAIALAVICVGSVITVLRRLYHAGRVLKDRAS